MPITAISVIVQRKPYYKRKGEKMHRRLTSAARCAIEMRSQDNDVTTAIRTWNVTSLMALSIAIISMRGVVLISVKLQERRRVFQIY